MPRAPRAAPGGVIYHVLNRAVGRRTLFFDNPDYAAFERVLAEAAGRYGTRVLAWCVMPNHWHLVLWPRADGELSAVMGWLTTTHARRWHQHRHTWGEGHLYQGRFKCFPVQAEGPGDGGRHLRAVCRYVERNPLRAGLVGRAEDWPWSSVRARVGLPPLGGPAADRPVLEPLPVEGRADWLAWVNEPQTAAADVAELEDLRTCASRGRPYGAADWQRATSKRLGLEFTFRRRGPVPKAEREGKPS